MAEFIGKQLEEQLEPYSHRFGNGKAGRLRRRFHDSGNEPCKVRTPEAVGNARMSAGGLGRQPWNCEGVGLVDEAVVDRPCDVVGIG